MRRPCPTSLSCDCTATLGCPVLFQQDLSDALREAVVYSSQQAFDEAVLLCGQRDYEGLPLRRSTLDNAYLVYRKAYVGNELALAIAGRLALSANGRLVPADESFPTIDQIMMENFGTLGENDGRTGSILAASDWSLLVNDSWLLGVIHSRTEIHFASPLTISNLWDDSRNTMTVMGREAVGVASSGYRIFQTMLEPIAQNVDPRRSRSASFLTYLDARRSVTSEHDMLSIISLPG